MPDLLLELFSEEIPARMQARAATDLKRLVTDALAEAVLPHESAGAFSTPRRLTLTVEGLPAASPALGEVRRGPRIDAPEKAIEGFLRGVGMAREQLEIRKEKKGSVYFATIQTPGRPAAEIIAEIVPKVIRGFPWPKSMRWGDGTLRWVRPLHRILCLLSAEDGTTPVRFNVDGIEASVETEGHRFMAPGAFSVTCFEDYQAKLKCARVILSAEERAFHIREDAQNLAFAAGLELVEDKGLLTEVAGLVEWPVVLMGKIGTDFLNLPPEVLQTSMKVHQKFFSVRNSKTGRIEHFITVANRETADQGATILGGNEKVLAARLSDAKFFWENDVRVAKAGMGDWLEALKAVTFERHLGSVADRISRIAMLAREIAPPVGAIPDAAEQAARIAQADLASEMVREFPELQGVMGRYYAQAAGFDIEVATVAEEHYQPLGPADDVPTAPLSVAVALAEKIDKLTGFWTIDEKPTGSKDPFALRRAALGVIRIVIEEGKRLSIAGLIEEHVRILAFSPNMVNRVFVKKCNSARDKMVLIGNLAPPINWDPEHTFIGSFAFDPCDPDTSFPLDENKGSFRTPREIVGDLLAFFHDRLKVHLRGEGIFHDVINSCLAMPQNDDLTLVVARARALAAFLSTEDGVNLVQGYKRAANILAQAEVQDGVEYRRDADVKFAETGEERALFAALATAEVSVTAHLQAVEREGNGAALQAHFAAAMTELAHLRGPIDAFFEAVQVNADSQVVRRNRLNLLHQIVNICGQVANLARLEGA
ncbi:MAG: glycine--tRNA ligase subunit beta [Rhodobacteraceae bacterium]|nr:glycine--tRNA ligase subunit beta [Paracoccaceae bacterium]